MIDNLEEYFKEKLNEAFRNHFEMYIRYDSISTDIHWDDELFDYLDFNKCKLIFPNINTKYVEYECPCDDMMSGNETSEEVHFIGIDMSELTKDKVDAFCDIMADGYSKYLRGNE